MQNPLEMSALPKSGQLSLQYLQESLKTRTYLRGYSEYPLLKNTKQDSNCPKRQMDWCRGGCCLSCMNLSSLGFLLVQQSSIHNYWCLKPWEVLLERQSCSNPKHLNCNSGQKCPSQLNLKGHRKREPIQEAQWMYRDQNNLYKWMQGHHYT